jgi:hypothetical protein
MSITYNGIRQAVEETGISKEILTRAKVHPSSPKGLFGFHSSGRIYWDKPDANGLTLEAWITEHLPELKQATPDTIEYWQTMRIKWQALALEKKLEDKRAKVVNKQDVLATLEKMSVAFRALVNGRFRSQVIDGLKLTSGQVADLDNALADINGVWDKQISAWQK